MNVLPVVVRELREQARQPATYWLRLLGAAGLLTVGVLFTMDRGLGYRQGQRLFSSMHWVLFCTIWGLVPIMTADCISRERREGTLGLLFLTPLTARDVVLAKGLVHGLRAATVAVAAVPVLVIPFLLGGVDWGAVMVALVLNLGSFFAALAAGLLASSRQFAMHRAVVWAYVLAGFLFFGLILFSGWWLSMVFSLGLPQAPLGGAWGRGLLFSLSELFDFEQFSLAGRVPWPTLFPWQMLFFCAGLVGGVLVGFLLVVGRAAANLRGLILERRPSELRLKLERTFCTPKLAPELFRRWMRWRLERNPLGWLEQRTWQARLVTWSWLAVLISFYSLILSEPNYFSRSFDYVQNTLSTLVLISMAATASGSFRRERETRVLELLLVSPLTPRQIVLGRLWGLWGQFLPALVLLVGVWLYMADLPSDRPGFRLGNWWVERMELLPMLRFGAAFLALPIIGLYFSLRCRFLVTSFVWTLVCVFLVPWVMVRLVFYYISSELQVTPQVLSPTAYGAGYFGLPILLYALLAFLLGLRLQRNLAERRFVFS
jgi:ABC-type transport system involved in multi-copper enzyme maturation permease subunit